LATEEKVLCGIISPQVHRQLPIDLSEIQSYLRRAEELGFHSVWVTEQSSFGSGASALEGVTMLSYAAAVTSRLRLGTAVLAITLRSPIHLAKALASLDQLSRGRLIVGVGLGAAPEIYGAYGLSPERRVARFNEALSYIQRLWTEENLTFVGQFWQNRNANLLPKPFQKPHPPIWFGGSAPAALKRAVRLGSGFIGAGSSSTADFKSHVQIIRQELHVAGKDPREFFLAKRVYLAVDRDRERARSRLREWFGTYYRKPDRADRVAVWGSPEECVERLQEVVSAGARLVLLSPVFDRMEQMETLARDVVPSLTSQKA
jgi:probable F420-dependent oxidoreductase